MPATNRPTRRAAARRQTIVESSDSESEEQISDFEDAKTAPPPTPRRPSRKSTATTPATSTAPRSSRARRTASVDPQPPLSSTKSTVKRPRGGRKPHISEDASESNAEEDKDEEDEEDGEETPKPKPVKRPRVRKQPRISESAEEETPPPAPSPAKRAPRGRRQRISVESNVEGETPAPTPAKRGRGRKKSHISESASESNVEEETPAPGSPTPVPGSPTPVPTIPPAEKQVVNPQVAQLQGTQAQLETPSPTPVPTEVQAPLADITDANNEIKSRPSSSQKPDPPPIVVKSRANILLQQQSEEPAEAKPRLVITHLVLVNFKSYAGRQEVGPFHASFSSVVGPNGSGKSNVIDSLLFVFGFRASKMRQGKISALIHNSAAFPNLEYCEVEVHFQQVMDLPEGGSEAVPDSTLVVSRRAFKNNSSKYYIDGRTSDYTQVTTLLRGRGIDLDHKRFLILQGEVESIAQMKPKAQSEHDDGLLEYLEDIIGTSKYKQPIEESSTQVDEMNDVCLEKKNRVQHVEKEKDSLEDKKNLALEYIRNENELAMKKSALYQIHIQDSDANIRVTSDMLMQLQTELDEELEKHRGSEEGIKKLEKKYKQGMKEIEDLEKQTQAILREVARYDKENVKYLEKEKFLVQKQKKLEKVIHQNKLSASEATGLISKHTADTERFGQEISQLDEKLEVENAELEKIRDDLKEKTQGFSDQISILQKSLEPWNEKINQRRSTIAVTQSELDILHEKNNASKVALEEAVAKIATIQEARKTKQAELKECQKERAKMQKEVQLVQSGYDKLVQKEPQFRSTLSSARQKADEAKSSLAASQSQGNVLTGLMRLKESGRIEGFHGRLGNLGTIDAKYDVAISTACPQLDNMVVDTVEAGQQCIDYLRKNNLGRANFICLDRLPKRDLSPIDTPENAPRLFDLIKPKNEILGPAFYSVVYDTLVAKDLSQANRIAYGAKRWRVVTLDGQLIDKSGTMTGGGTTVSKGRMSSKLVAETSKEAVQKLERERDAQELSFQEYQAQSRQLETDLRNLHERIPELDVTMSKIELEIESSVRHLADAERRVQELEKEQGPSSSADNNRQKILEKKINTLETEIEQLNAETSGIEEEIKVLQDKIMEVGGIKLRSQKSKVDSIREQLETLNQQVNAADVARTKAEKAKAKNEKIVADSEQEVETVGSDLETLREEMQERSQAANESKERAEEAQDYLEKKKDELAEFKEGLDEKLTELNQTRAAEIEMKNKLEEYQKMLADNQKRSKHWQSELGKLNFQNVSDISSGDDEAGVQELPTYTEDELNDIDKNQLNAQIAVLEEKVQNVNVDLAVLQEYRRRVEEHASRSSDLENAVNSRDQTKQRLDDFRKRRLEEFMEGFSIISLRLKEMYQMITMGGNAELELVDSLDPFSEGILFSVMPPKKSWKNISNLSGGEKTLSSLALVFALHHYKPTPLYVMDEIDAALDFRNVSIVASYIQQRTKNAQFIVISLRNNMFELAARLVGVYKVNHMTKSVTIENRDYVKAR